MNLLRKCLVSLLGFSICIAGGILVMIYGWGVQPQNWWWIIGCNIGIQCLAQIIIVIGTKE